MKVIFFSSKHYDEEYFIESNSAFKHQLRFVDAHLCSDSVSIIDDETAVCAFVNDTLDCNVLTQLSQKGVKLIAMRCAGYNNVDLNAANDLGLTVVRVPAYSPNAVAEHTVCLILSLNRKMHRSYNRVRDGNFSLEGLLGFDLAGRTAGIIGTGQIGSIVTRILIGIGMKVLACDPSPNKECEANGVEYVSLDKLLTDSDIISLHSPLTPETKHIINHAAIEKMKPGVMIINTSRGAMLDTCAVIDGLKSKNIGYLGLDVYEQESELFFEDLSCEIIQDDIFERLLTFPNVLITAHQGFFTSDALKNIADTTLENISSFEQGKELKNKI